MLSISAHKSKSILVLKYLNLYFIRVKTYSVMVSHNLRYDT